MNVTKLPFNDFIGLEFSDNPHYILMLNDKSKYHNHLDTGYCTRQCYVCLGGSYKRTLSP